MFFGERGGLPAAFVWRQSEWLRGETVPQCGSGSQHWWPVVVQVKPSRGINDMEAYHSNLHIKARGGRWRLAVISFSCLIYCSGTDMQQNWFWLQIKFLKIIFSLSAIVVSCLFFSCLDCLMFPSSCLLRDVMFESKRKMERPIETQRPLVCAARRMTKALPPVISLYLQHPASFHPFIIAVFLMGIFLFSSISLCSWPLLTLLHWLFIPFQLPPPNISFSSLALISVLSPFPLSFLSRFCLLPPLIISLPSPTLDLQTPHCLLIFFPLPTISHIVYTLSTSQLLCCFTPCTLLLSFHLLLHIFSPVCCDCSQAGDSWNSRQSGSWYQQREARK